MKLLTNFSNPVRNPRQRPESGYFYLEKAYRRRPPPACDTVKIYESRRSNLAHFPCSQMSGILENIN
jgi:hypothetical protein